MQIVPHLNTTTQNLRVSRQNMLIVDSKFIIIQKSNKFRLVSQIDLAYYTPKDLANAINTNTVEQYYEQMLNDKRSDPNKWKRLDEEMGIKSFYAARSHRADLL